VEQKKIGSVNYAGRMGKSGAFMSIPLTQFACDDDVELRKIIILNNLIGCSHDETVRLCEQWVIKNIKYVSDSRNNDRNEHWQFHWETLQTMRGDCEDGAILLLNLLLNAGIPKNRILVRAGWVVNNGRRSGHAYVIYNRNQLGEEFIPIDWCYHIKNNVIAERETLLKSKLYLKPWFQFGMGQSAWL